MDYRLDIETIANWFTGYLKCWHSYRDYFDGNGTEIIRSYFFLLIILFQSNGKILRSEVEVQRVEYSDSKVQNAILMKNEQMFQRSVILCLTGIVIEQIPIRDNRFGNNV